MLKEVRVEIESQRQRTARPGLDPVEQLLVRDRLDPE
jgi:hypothetical protein